MIKKLIIYYSIEIFTVTIMKFLYELKKKDIINKNILLLIEKCTIIFLLSK